MTYDWRAAAVFIGLLIGGAVIIELWQAMAQPIAPSDTFIVTAGCDKRFSTCRDRFENVLNFRGFPHIHGYFHLAA